MIKITQSGSFKNTDRFLKNVSKVDYRSVLNRYGQEGVDALSNATPVDSGETSYSWTYEVTYKNGQYKLEWYNTHMAGSAPVAILIQYGHATRNGGYVEGIDFINPALKPIFEKMANDAWKEVTNA